MFGEKLVNGGGELQMVVGWGKQAGSFLGERRGLVLGV